MCKKPILIIFVVLAVVLSGLGSSDAVLKAAISDANLVLWYKLDDGSGLRADDSSGYNRDGDIEVWPEDLTVQWDPDGGHDGGCLIFFDDTRIVVPKSTLSGASSGITVSLWLKDAWRLGQNWTFDAATDWEAAFRVTAAIGTAPDTEVLWQAGNDSNDTVRWDGGNVQELEGWHLWTFVKDETADNIRIYFDGLPAASKGSVDDTLRDVLPTELADPAFKFHIGASSSHWNHLKAWLDEFRLYDRAGGDPAIAWKPDPADGVENLCDDVVLSWTPGDLVTQHDVYFGTDFDAVNDATIASNPYIGRQGSNTYDAGAEQSLQPGVTYYWRIDEVSGGVQKGQVWQFSINDGSAFDPDPADGEEAVLREAVLSWSAGCWAASHDVYFGTDEEQVTDATTASAVYKGNQPLGETSYDPCDFDYLTDYYWRIDEVNGPTTWKGEVWSFKSQTRIIDPNNTLWYKLDETEGYVARDSSNFLNDGVVDMPGGGPPAWEPVGGQWGGCLSINDDTAIWVPTDVLSRVTSGVGIIFWTKEAANPVLHANGGDSQLLVSFSGSEVVWRAGNDSTDVLRWTYTGPGGWTHWAFVKDEAAGSMSIYCNGQLAESNSVATHTLAGVRNKPFKIGAETNIDGDFDGRIDDFIVYDRALSGNEIERQYQIGGPVGKLALAWMPEPQNRQTDVYRDTNLAWKPGDYAIQHDVYFGTDWTDVNDATTASTSIYKGRQDPCAYDPTGDLELNETYYWRIDEVNEPNVWKGMVWEFTVGNFLVLDDFESYNIDLDDLYWFYGGNWLDGIDNSTGSTLLLGVEPEPTHSGVQSLMCVYQNKFSPYYSEAERVINPGERDWTAEGTKILTLFFMGTAGNATSSTEQMNAGIKDGAANYAEVHYGDQVGEDMSDLEKEEWQAWDIALADFNGVSLGDVRNLYISFGQSGGTTAGGGGTLQFDDIRLYRPKCVPERLKPECDFSDNCVVDIADVGIMASQWLRTDACLPVSAPGPNPVGWWKLDGNASDSSTYANHGAAEGSFEWVTGHIGTGAIEFTGDGGRVLVPDATVHRPANTITAMAWVNYSQPTSYTARIVTKGVDEDDHENFAIQLGGGDFSWFVRDVNTTLLSVDSEQALGADEWAHLAGTCDGSDVKCYVNGLPGGSRTIGTIALLQDSNSLSIGDAVDVERAFFGKVDDVRLYNVALSAENIAYIATQGTGYVPLPTEVNVYDSEPAGSKAVNFKDYAMVMEKWLEEKLWPVE